MTFAELGIVFPLFDAPVEEASDFVPRAACVFCDTIGPGFAAWIGGAVMIACPACGTANGLDTHDRADGVCRDCGAAVAFPVWLRTRKIVACATCLQEGRIALTKDTELGMVRWEDAADGLTHGDPGLHHPDFETEPSPDDSKYWRRARVPSEVLTPLLRTPKYLTWQGERWRFCCRQAMTYVGDQTSFSSRFPEVAAAQMASLRHDADLHPDDTACTLYVFRCGTCGRHRAHADCD